MCCDSIRSPVAGYLCSAWAEPSFWGVPLGVRPGAPPGGCWGAHPGGCWGGPPGEDLLDPPVLLHPSCPAHVSLQPTEHSITTLLQGTPTCVQGTHRNKVI